VKKQYKTKREKVGKRGFFSPKTFVANFSSKIFALKVGLGQEELQGIICQSQTPGK